MAGIARAESSAFPCLLLLPRGWQPWNEGVVPAVENESRNGLRSCVSREEWIATSVICEGRQERQVGALQDDDMMVTSIEKGTQKSTFWKSWNGYWARREHFLAMGMKLEVAFGIFLCRYWSRTFVYFLCVISKNGHYSESTELVIDGNTNEKHFVRRWWREQTNIPVGFKTSLLDKVRSVSFNFQKPQGIIINKSALVVTVPIDCLLLGH